MDNLKIAVVGIGGIGGSLGAFLYQRYGEQVNFIARGKRAESLKQKGLVLHSELIGEYCTGPLKNVEEDGGKFGVQDIIFICLKNYSLDSAAPQIRPMVDKHTILVPVMNGIEPGDHVRSLFPEGIGLDGVIYCTSTAQPDYSIDQRGKYYTIYLGSKVRDERHVKAAAACAEVLKEAVEDTRYSDKIEAEIWTKYILNCAYNTASARYNQTVGSLREDPKKSGDYRKLLEEAWTVAVKAEIPVAEDLVEVLYDRFLHMYGPESTSSLREDIRNHRPTELDAFGGALLRKAHSLGLDLPVTREYYEALKRMTAGE